MGKANKLFKLTIDRPRNVKNDILSGLTVALALVPEAIAFSLVAHVNPLVGLYGAFMMCLITAVFGGRPGMISGATGSMAENTTCAVMPSGNPAKGLKAAKSVDSRVARSESTTGSR